MAVPLAFNVPVVSLCFSSVSVQWSEQTSLPGCRKTRGISETSRHGEDAEGVGVEKKQGQVGVEVMQRGIGVGKMQRGVGMGKTQVGVCSRIPFVF